MVRRRLTTRSTPLPASVIPEPAPPILEPTAPVGLHAWLAALPGAPEVHRVVEVGCPNHGDEPSWAYVEADASAGAARRRCLACGEAVSLLDSEARWTYPTMWACRECGQSIAELAAGLHMPDGEHVQWAVVGARCVACNTLTGVTDFVLPGQPVDEVLAAL